MTKCSDYGIFQLSVDGKKAGAPIDLYDPKIQPTDAIPLGTYTLAAGEHTLGVEIVGTNPAAKANYIFGIDQIVIEPALDADGWVHDWQILRAWAGGGFLAMGNVGFG